MDKRKVFGTILGAGAFIAFLLVVTYAFYVWRSNETDVTINISDSYFYCESGIEESASGLQPVLDYKDGSVYSFKVNNIGNSAESSSFSISMKIKENDTVSNLFKESFKYVIMADTTGGNNDCTTSSNCTEIATGNFKNFKVGMNTLAETVSIPNDSRYEYFLFLYIDGNMSNDTAMQSSTLEFTLDVCEVVAFLDYNGGNVISEFVKITGDTYGETTPSIPTSVTKSANTIKYNTNGGNTISDTTITHTFNGWYKDEGTWSNKVETTTLINTTLNHTLYAKWTPSVSSVTYPTPTRAGYKFEGWYTDEGFTKSAGSSYSISNDTTGGTTKELYAKWTPNVVTININKDGAAWSASDMQLTLYNGTTATTYTATVSSGSQATLSAVPNGTYNIYAGKSSLAKTTLLDSGVDVTVNNNSPSAVTVNYYTLTLEKGTGISAVSQVSQTSTLSVQHLYNASSPQTIAIDATVTSGYTWSTWTKTSGTNLNTFTAATKSQSIKMGAGAAVYKANATDTTKPTVTITRSDYNTFSWTASDNVAVTGYAITTSSSTPSSWTTTGTLTSGTYDISAAGTYYVWAKDAAGNVSASSTSASASIKAYTISRSQGTGTTLTTRYDSTSSSTGTTFTSNTVVLHGTPIWASATANSGYKDLTLKHGNTSMTASGGTFNASATETIASSATLNDFTVTFNVNGGSAWTSSTCTGSGISLSSSTCSKTVIYNSTYGTLPTPIRTGYKFDGWYTAASGGTKIESATTVTITANQTLYAHWTAYKVNIKYSVNGGTVQASTTASNGTQYTWTTDSNGIIFKSENGGTATDILQTINYNSSTSSTGLINYDHLEFLMLTKTGYRIPDGSEWKCLSGDCQIGTIYSDEGVYNAGDFCDASSGDCTVVLGANWYPHSLDITINKGGSAWSSSGMKVSLSTSDTSDTATKTVTVSSGSTTQFTWLSIGTTYYIWAGKSDAAKSTTAYTGLSIVAGTDTSATINYYTLTLNKGTGVSSVTGAGTYLSNQTVNINAVKSSGYTFSGWSVDSGNSPTSTALASTTISTNNTTTLTATATLNKVTIKYSVNGGTITTPTTNSDSTSTYTWTTDSSGIISKSTNGGTASDSFSTINYGKATGSSGLVNFNNKKYINILKVSQTASPGAEWKCLSGSCTVGTTYSQSKVYNASDFCDASASSCTVVLGVNWVGANYAVQTDYNATDVKGYYINLNDAISAADSTNYNKIILIRNYTETEQIVFNKNLAFSTFNYTLTLDAVNIVINDGVKVETRGNGTINAVDNRVYTVYGTLIVATSGKLESNIVSSTEGFSVIRTVENGEVFMFNGTLSSDSYYAINVQSTGGADIGLYGGSIEGSEANKGVYIASTATTKVILDGFGIITSGNAIYNSSANSNIIIRNNSYISSGAMAIANLSGGNVRIGSSGAETGLFLKDIDGSVLSGTKYDSENIEITCSTDTTSDPCITNQSTGTLNIYEGSFTSNKNTITNVDQGILRISPLFSDNPSLIVIRGTGDGFSTIRNGTNDTTGSNAFLRIESGVEVYADAANNAILNHSGYIEIYDNGTSLGNAKIVSTNDGYATIINKNETYSAGASADGTINGKYYWGRIWITGGRVISQNRAITSHVKHNYGIVIGNASGAFYNYSNFNFNNTKSIPAPYVRGVKSGVYISDKTYKYRLNNGIVGTDVSNSSNPSNVVPSTGRSGYKPTIKSSTNYKWYHLVAS